MPVPRLLLLLLLMLLLLLLLLLMLQRLLLLILLLLAICSLRMSIFRVLDHIVVSTKIPEAS